MAVTSNTIDQAHAEEHDPRESLMFDPKPRGEMNAMVMESMEKTKLLAALEESGGNKSQAARLLGMKRTTYVRRLAKYIEE